MCPLEWAKTQTRAVNAVFVSSILEFGCDVAGHYSGAQAQQRGKCFCRYFQDARFWRNSPKE